MKEQKLSGMPFIDKPWLKYYSEDAILSKVPNCTMYEYIKNNNKAFSDNEALLYFNKKYSYKNLLSSIDQTAAAFSALGIRHGDVVTIQSLTLPQVVFAIYALSKIGAIANLIYANMDGKAVLQAMHDANSHVLVVMEPIFSIIQDNFADADLKAVIVVNVQDEMSFVFRTLYNFSSKTRKINYNSFIMPWKSFYKSGQGQISPIVGKSSDPVLMVYTGGTTGKSKAVLLSNYNVNAGALQYFYLGFDRGKTMLCSLPPFIAFGITVTLHTPLSFGLKVALCISSDPSELGQFVVRYKPNYIICGTAQAENLMTYFKAKSKFDLSFLRCLSVGGDTLPEKMEDSLNDFLMAHNAKIRIAQGYAMTETSAASVASTRTIGTTVYKKGTVGVPLVHTNIKIVDPDTGKALTYNKDGEICISGPCTMMEYFNETEETKQILKTHEDNITWVHTGDIGSIDEDGFIRITGRIKRMILTYENGVFHKVFPKLLENQLEKCIGIKSVAIVGKPKSEESLYHDLVAFVVLENGFIESQAIVSLSEYSQRHFESFERPYKYIFVKELPRTLIGKINHRALEAQIK